MFSIRTLTLGTLTLIPVFVYLALGGYALWQTGLFRWTWWIIPGCWLATWMLAMLWRRPSAAAVVERALPGHWTPRDKAAAAVIRRFQEGVDSFTPRELTDPRFYLDRARELADDLARHYHPGAPDPISSLTVPEVLAAVRLAVDDMEQWMLESVPGSRLLTIQQWRWLGESPKWLRHIRDAAWATSILVNPVNLVKYLTSKVALDPVTQELQAEFLAAVYLRFIRQTGFYLIEMNSGRLRGGADRYRRAFERDRLVGRSDQRASTSTTSTTDTESSPGRQVSPGVPSPGTLTVAVVGQVKAGKSSLINALLGERKAETDVLPMTSAVTRYRLPLVESGGELLLLDTPGYADSGATKSQMDEVTKTVREADVLVLVLAANAPARAADREVMDELAKWYQRHEQLKPPPLVLCLTHIDLLSPVMEWNPPYDWQQPLERKARSIHDAVTYARDVFADLSPRVVPVCTDVERGRATNIIEELLPMLASVLDDGKATALLRTYHEELDRDRIKQLLQQFKTGGKTLWKIWWEERQRNGTS